MYKTNIVDTDSFLMFQIINESFDAVDSVVINKYGPDNVLHFYNDVDEYIEEYSEKMRTLIDTYEEKLDFDNAIENRSIAEFTLYQFVKGLD